MPERVKAVGRMTERRVGGPVVWNGLYGTIERGQTRTVEGVEVEMTLEVWTAQREKADDEYCRIVRGIDWERVLIEAASWHTRRRKADESHTKSFVYGDTCGACLREALLSEDRNWLREKDPS